MRSAVYEGVLTHRRSEPAHAFTRRIGMPLLDLGELDAVVDRHPLWARERANAVSVRRRDFLGPSHLAADVAVRDLVEARTGVRPVGPVAVLAHARTWGWLFNPIAMYYCFDRDGSAVAHAVAHVTNTPWKEQHSYVLGEPGTHPVAKALHVSPFLGMDQDYRITYSEPGDSLRVHIAAHHDDRVTFTAGLTLTRRPLDRAALSRILWRYPMLTARVSMAIHTQAIRLWRKGAIFHSHPAKTEQESTDARTDDTPRRSHQVA